MTTLRVPSRHPHAVLVASFAVGPTDDRLEGIDPRDLGGWANGDVTAFRHALLQDLRALSPALDPDRLRIVPVIDAVTPWYTPAPGYSCELWIRRDLDARPRLSFDPYRKLEPEPVRPAAGAIFRVREEWASFRRRWHREVRTYWVVAIGPHWHAPLRKVRAFEGDQFETALARLEGLDAAKYLRAEQ